MQEIEEKDFADAIAQGKVLVDFWAPWCGPCRVLHPVLEELEQERDDLKIISVNIDNNPAIARDWQVESIPTMLLFQDGRYLNRLIGALPKRKLVQELDALGF